MHNRLPSHVVKRDGRVVDFDSGRILEAIRKAILATRGREFLQSDKGKAATDSALEGVLDVLSKKYGSGGNPQVEEIQNFVEQSLMESNLYDVAKAYVIYRRERERIRDEKKRMLEKDSVDEVDKAFSLNAIRLLASRYLLRDERGKIIEGPKQMFQRVAGLIVISDVLHDPRVFDLSARQEKRARVKFDLSSLLRKKLGLKRSDGSFELEWNQYHLERMHELYHELNDGGQMKVSWEELVDLLERGDLQSRYLNNYLAYFGMMVEKKFFPNSPTLFNAGARLGQLSACFVIPIGDSIESIMRSASECALIFQSGGGVGINYSALRPEGDIVASTGGVASGPVTFMRIVDTVTDVVKQGGKRRGANMGILDITHPDIEKFIRSKYETKLFENFNISVLVVPEFFSSYERGEQWALKNPRDKSIWRSVDPRQLFRLIATMAWNTADPGVVFQDAINATNPLRECWGDIICTNPCGEQPMYPYESCNLGSVNVYPFVKFKQPQGSDPAGAPYLDWDELARMIELATRLLDNVIDINKFPIQEIARTSKETRRIGLGLMGLADAMYALGITYNSEEGFAFMGKLAEFFAYHSIRASAEIALERGSFPLFDKSSYKDGDLPLQGFHRREMWTLDWQSLSSLVKRQGIRNSHTMTIAPTGSISMIADTSSGLEPQFALVFEKHVSVGSFYYTDPELERQLAALGGVHDEALREISENGGSLQGLEDHGYDSLRKVFLVAYDIPWWDHIRAQYEMQKWISASVSKTINMPSWASIEDVERAYLFAYKLGLKGITIYRDGSKGEQVLRTPSQRQNRYVNPVRNDTLELMMKMGIEITPEQRKVALSPTSSHEKRASGGSVIIQQRQLPAFPAKCPICGGTNIVYQEACRKCPECGWSTCTVA
jgi:ribonucleoside-diphosphate reductase alpha chain